MTQDIANIAAVVATIIPIVAGIIAWHKHNMSSLTARIDKVERLLIEKTEKQKVDFSLSLNEKIKEMQLNISKEAEQKDEKHEMVFNDLNKRNESLDKVQDRLMEQLTAIQLQLITLSTKFDYISK